MSRTVFIDGAAGTTGLEIVERLSARPEFSPLVLGEERRKQDAARAEALNDADFVILCLPDEAARQAVAMIKSDRVRVIDASTAHRTAKGWVYGLPEVVGAREVASARRVSNPGCYSTGFIALVAPLVSAGLLPADWPYVCHAVSGFSGGGKALIARFRAEPDIVWRGYGLGLGHKHVPEMQAHCGLKLPPLFSPAVVNAYRGMVVEVPLPLAAMPKAAPPDVLLASLHETYLSSPVITVCDEPFDELLLTADAAPHDGMELFVFASADRSQARLMAQLDNLGKGASGATVQSLNLMAGLDETAGLRL
ncbi:MAG: N-acetyl-gamma-glutamyl-phosphate reductase [Alphaproteobacteria bacterium]|nr:N-acetyl-gamma-glutamyl-phosphate reductase [Alphaproteobacteria bacterium]